MVPAGQNFRRGSRQRKFEFNIYKLGKLHRVAVDKVGLPRNKENELIYSDSNNDDMIGPLLEKALVDLHFDGDYESTYGICFSFVLSSFTNSYYEDFPSVSIGLTFDISEVINHGLKTNSPMVVSFEVDTADGLLLKNHYYTLVNVTNNVVKLYNPNGHFRLISKTCFYKNLVSFQISYFKNKVFRFPEIENSVEFYKTWAAMKQNKSVNFKHFNLVSDEDNTGLLINLIFKKDPNKVIEPQIFITTDYDDVDHNQVIQSSVFYHKYESG